MYIPEAKNVQVTHKMTITISAVKRVKVYSNSLDCPIGNNHIFLHLR